MKDQHTSETPEQEIEVVLETYGHMLFRICLLTLGNTGDAEDALQETMIQYLQKRPVFRDAEHQKAWLITVVTNRCRDILRFRRRHPVAEINANSLFAPEQSDSGILEALMTLPEKYRTVLLLYYVEEYSTKQIAGMIHRSTSAVKMRLAKGRRLLAEVYRKEYL